MPVTLAPRPPAGGGSECPARYARAVAHEARGLAESHGLWVEADDLTQIGLMAVHAHWGRFRPELSSRRTWAHRTARRAMLDAIRAGVQTRNVVRVPKGAVARGHAVPSATADGLAALPAKPAAASPAAEAEELAASLRRHLGRDPLAREVAVAVGRYCRDLGHAEIGRELGVTMQRAHQIHGRLIGECRAARQGVAGVPS